MSEYPKTWTKFEMISALYCASLQGRNPYNFWLIFWEKRWLHKFILKFTDLYYFFNCLSWKFFNNIIFSAFLASPKPKILKKSIKTWRQLDLSVLISNLFVAKFKILKQKSCSEGIRRFFDIVINYLL